MRHKRPSQAGEGGGQSGALCRGLPASFDGSIGPAQVVGDLIFSPVGRAETGGGRGVRGIFFKSALEESDGAFYFFGRDVVLQIAQALDVVIICGGRSEERRVGKESRAGGGRGADRRDK